MTRRRPLTLRSLRFALCLLALSSLPFAAHAQTTSATLSGTVEDQHGAAVPGVKVTITNSATGLERSVTTNESGAYVIPLLQPAKYDITAEHEGFKRVLISGFVLNVGDQKSLRIQLEVGQVDATVTVSSDDIAEVRTDGSVGTIVNRQFVANIPLNGRSFQSLLELTPGVTLFKANPNTTGGGQFSINGQRTDANYFMVDGVGANTGITTSTGGFAGQSAAGQLPGLTALGTTQSLVSVDALQEFRVQTSTYAPEFGRTPGGQISMLTRSGANSFHGTLFEYFRNEALDANDWFANATSKSKPPERQNDFGGILSGPILLPRFGEGGRQPSYNGRNRTFFFFSYEGLRLRLPQVKLVGVPTLTLRQQVPPAVRTLLEGFPLPNGRDLGNGVAEFAASYADPSRLDATALRIDHSVRGRVLIFGRYSRTPSTRGTRTLSLNTISNASYKNNSLTFGITWNLSNRVINDFRANWTRTRAAATLEADTLGGSVPPTDTVLFPSPLTRNSAYFLVSLNGSPGFALGTGNNNFQRQFNLIDSLGLVKGTHNLKLGLDYRQVSPILGRAGGNFFNYGFGSPSNALEGRLDFAQIASGTDETVARYTNMSSYVQDTWNTTRRLTLTYGLRWELNLPPSSPNNHLPFTIENIRAPEPVSFAPRNTPLWKTTYTNFAPRIGVAYRLSQASGHELVIRGGFGVFYDTGFGVSGVAFDNVYPFYVEKVLFGVNYPLSGANAQPPVIGTGIPSQLWVMDRHLKLPYTYQWNVAMEQSFGSRQTLTVSYVGSAGRRLLRVEISNLLFKEFGSTRIPVNYSNNSATSDYRALQLQFHRRLARGLQALVNYTLSKSSDTVSDDAAFQSNIVPGTQIDLSREYGPSDFDVRHVFTSGLTYDLPKSRSKGFVRTVFSNNWGIDALIRWRTAFPLFVLTSVRFPARSYSVRPNLVPGVQPMLIGSQFPGGKALNPSAFSIPAAGTVGNFPRNSLRGFPAEQVDLALRRQFALSEKLKMQFRFEVFNVLNHPNFADPSVLIVSGRTAPIMSTQMLNRGIGGLNALYQVGGPRSAQVAVKFLF